MLRSIGVNQLNVKMNQKIHHPSISLQLIGSRGQQPKQIGTDLFLLNYFPQLLGEDSKKIQGQLTYINITTICNYCSALVSAKLLNASFTSDN